MSAVSAPTEQVTQWQKSSFSGVDGEDCVELAHYKGQILIRESAAPAAAISIAPERLQSLLVALKPEQQQLS